MNLNHFFDIWEKLDILDDFFLRVRNVELELKGNCEHTKSTVGLVFEKNCEIDS